MGGIDTINGKRPELTQCRKMAVVSGQRRKAAEAVKVRMAAESEGGIVMKILLLIAVLAVLAVLGDHLISSFDELVEKYYHKKDNK